MPILHTRRVRSLRWEAVGWAWFPAVPTSRLCSRSCGLPRPSQAGAYSLANCLRWTSPACGNGMMPSRELLPASYSRSIVPSVSRAPLSPVLCA